MSDYYKNILLLTIGTGLAQIISFLISPVLTRLYSPTDFGAYSVFTSVFAIATSVSTLRYDSAINIPRQKFTAFILLISSIAISIIFSLVLALIIFLALLYFAETSIAQSLGNWWFLLSPLVLVFSAANAYNFWLNRHARFDLIAKSRIVTSSSTGVAQILTHTISTVPGLIVGFCAGQILYLIYYLTNKVNLDSHQFKRLKKKLIFLTLKKYIKFPLVQAPAVLLESASYNAPLFLFAIFFGAETVGLFALSQRVVRAPLSIITSSFSEVFKQKIAFEMSTHGDSAGVFLSALQKLVGISILPFLFFFLLSPVLFSTIFGNNWKLAGEFAQIITPMLWFSFVVSPLSIVITIAEKQEYDLLIQVVLLATSILAIITGFYLANNAKLSLILLTIVYCFKYAIELAFAYQLCQPKNAKKNIQHM